MLAVTMGSMATIAGMEKGGFGVFTFFPPKLPIFRDAATGT
jgi:hypothetical protein